MNPHSVTTVLERPGTLSGLTVRRTMDLLTDPAVADAEKVRLLLALQPRTIDPLTLAAFAREMRRRAAPFAPPGHARAIDLCGSGGAPYPTFNVSTVSAFVVAAAGQPVIKHGNRSARGHTGSSDLLETLGLPIISSREFSGASFRRYGLAFLHAPLFHPATRAVARARARLGVPTIFNRLGPLSNPARPRGQLVGVPDPASARRIVSALQSLGVRRGMTVTARERADEFSPCSPSQGFRWTHDALTRYTVTARAWLDPEDRRGPWGPLGPTDAAEATRKLLAGAPGARRGAVLLTSAAALRVGGSADSWREGMELATVALDSGAAEEKLKALEELAASRAWTDES